MLKNLLVEEGILFTIFLCTLHINLATLVNKKGASNAYRYILSTLFRNEIVLLPVVKLMLHSVFLFKVQEGGKHMGGGQREVSPPGRGSFRSISFITA